MPKTEAGKVFLPGFLNLLRSDRHVSHAEFTSVIKRGCLAEGLQQYGARCGWRAWICLLTVILAELRGESSGSVSRQPVGSSVEFVELARGIEPPTGGLQNRCSAN